MRLATWNINGLRARLDYLTLWLRERQPDVVGLQELKLTDEQFPHDALKAEGYHALVHGQKAWNGVAVLTKEPGTLVQSGLPGAEDMGARLLTSAVCGLSFTTVYCPNGKGVEHEDFPRKLAWFDRLVAHLDEHPDESRVLCGDFNICPAPIDSWSEDLLGGSIFHTAEERQRMEALERMGLRDSFRERYPDKKAYSWWDYRGGAFHRGRGLRIDLIMTTPSVIARTRETTIDRDFRKKKDGLVASDHAPVILDID